MDQQNLYRLFVTETVKWYSLIEARVYIELLNHISYTPVQVNNSFANCLILLLTCEHQMVHRTGGGIIAQGDWDESET